MIDHTAYYENIVKGEIAVTCQKLGLDKNDVGWAIGGHGAIGVLISPNPAGGPNQITFGPVWSITVSFRHLLLGQPRVGGSLPVPGVLPPDEHFRMVAQRLVTEVNAQREREFRGEMN